MASLVSPGTYEVVLNTDNPAYGGNGLTDDTVKHFTIADPLYEKREEGMVEVIYSCPYSSSIEENEINNIL